MARCAIGLGQVAGMEQRGLEARLVDGVPGFVIAVGPVGRQRPRREGSNWRRVRPVSSCQLSPVR